MNNNELKQKVYLAMSGGVDSSVAAYLLQQQGFDVTGVYMKNWSEESFVGDFKPHCPWKRDVKDVRAVCKLLGIPMKVYNFEKEYNTQVIDYFFAGEKKGLTPNPDIVCNRKVKFGLFLNRSLKDGAELIATGHYAKIRRKYNVSRIRYELHGAKDRKKDQTYFLCQLTQSQLSKTIFPLGKLTKLEVREIAKKLNLPTAEKQESMGICFVGEVDFVKFLKSRIKETPGSIVTPEGKIVGEHIGLPFYTIGQRKGIGFAGGVPYYVVEKNQKKNELVVAPGEHNPLLYEKIVEIKQISWQSGSSLRLPIAMKAQIRYRQVPQPATLRKVRGKLIVEFKSKQRAVTPGQFCAFYKNSVLLGCGVIV